MAGNGSDKMGHLHEDSMSHFIKTQMMTVMQPFLDHVEANDQRICKLEDLAETADDRITNSFEEIEVTNSTVKSAIENLRQTDRRVDALGEGLGKCADHLDQLQRGLEFSNEYAERVQNQARCVAAEVPELRRYTEMVEKQLQALQVQFQRLSDGVVVSHKARLDSLTDDVAGLQAETERSKSAHETLRGEVQEDNRLLQDARQELSRDSISIGAVQQTIKDMLAREKDLGGRLEGLKTSFSKLQPAFDGVKKEVVFLKQTAEAHDASIHGLQRGQQTLMESFEGLHGSQAKMNVELDATRRTLKQTNQALAEAHDNIGQNTSFSNGLHTRLDQSAAELGNTMLQLRGLEQKHAALCDVADKTNKQQDQMLQDSRKAANEALQLRRDLEKTNDSVAADAKQLEVLGRSLQGSKGDVVQLADRLTQMESSTQALHGGFAGLQKGFLDSGLEMSPTVAAKKSERLPRLGRTASKGSPVGSPRSGSKGLVVDAAPRLAAFAGDGDDDTTPGISRLGMNGMPSPSDYTPSSTQQSTQSGTRLPIDSLPR